MKHHIVFSTAVLLASFILGACSNDDEPKPDGFSVVTSVEAPSWQIDWQADDERPDWQNPDIQTYENWSIMKVQIEDELRPYTSTDDRLALFVAGECRGVQGPAIVVGGQETNTTTYLLKAWGNENNGEELNITLRYYSARLRHVFSFTTTITFLAAQDIGVGEDFVPRFTLGSSKYPIVMHFDAAPLLSKASVTPAAGDIIAAFVGSECRGAARLTDGNEPLTIYGRAEGETVTVRYHQASSGRIYTFPDAAKTINQ